MDTTQVTKRFLELLEHSGLLTPEQIADFARRFDREHPDYAQDMAKQLVAEGLITQFQAQRLLEGRARGFFIGRYKLLEVLGTGGMGGVYVAEDTRSGHQVALKVLSEKHKDDSGMLARLKLEALAGVRLRHPHIVRTYGIGHTGAIDYLVMEFVEGITLQELVTRQGRRPWPQACDFIAQAAAALEHAHQAGLVHRDIKPSNLLILHDGSVKILDFGLALVSNEEDNEFSLAMIFGHECIGSADYMAPEQSRDSFNVDARADIYSLGCTLYTALSGAFPFPAESASKMLEAHRSKQARPLSELAPDVPQGVVHIVDKMMAKQPEQRYQTADDVRRALQPFARREGVSFDFEAVLAVRAEDERRRSAAFRKRQSGHPSRSSSKSSLPTATTAAAKTDRQTQPAASGSSAERRGLSSPGQSDAAAKSESGRSGSETEARLLGTELPLDPSPVARSTNELGDAQVSEESGAETRRPISWSLSEHTRPTVPSAEPVSRAWLVPLDGGSSIPITSDPVVIGRNPDCDIQLAEGGVSGRHCELRRDGDWWRVTDLNSKNGTRVNGTAVKDQLLWSGDRLTIAEQAQFRFQTGRSPKGSRRRATWKWVMLGLLTAGFAAVITVLWLWSRM